MPEQTKETPKEGADKDYSESPSVEDETNKETEPAAKESVEQAGTGTTTAKEKPTESNDGNNDNDDDDKDSSSPEKEKTIGEDPFPAETATKTKATENEDNSDTDQYEDADISEVKDSVALAQEELVKNSTPTTELEIALTQILERKQALLDRLTGEINKMRNFVRKRKQTYKRKRKDGGAPVRALSAYNMFIRYVCVWLHISLLFLLLSFYLPYEIYLPPSFGVV
jgi:hypothetical protein